MITVFSRGQLTLLIVPSPADSANEYSKTYDLSLGQKQQQVPVQNNTVSLIENRDQESESTIPE